MRFDKLTTKFQQALADAQSAALAHDAGFIEPAHLLLALLNQEDGGAASLLQRAGVNVASLRKALEAAVARLPKVEGHGGEISVSRELGGLLNLTDKGAARRGDQYIASYIHNQVFVNRVTNILRFCSNLFYCIFRHARTVTYSNRWLSSVCAMFEPMQKI